MDAQEVLKTELLKLGSNSITVGSLGLALGLLVGAFIAAGLLKAALTRVRARIKGGGGAAFYVASQIGRYIIIFIGFMTAAGTLGLDLSSLSIFAGAIGVGVGLGLQDIVRDFISGLILLIDRSVEVGDFIELDTGTVGEVKNVGARATTILTNDNVDVLLPNSTLLAGQLTNWTRNRATRRIHVPFSVAYGSEKEKVRAAALEAAASVPFTLPDNANRKTQVWLTGFGDSSLTFELVVWPTLDAVKRPGSMLAAYRWAIDDALRKFGIEIPFPQQDVRIRSFFGHEGDKAMQHWQGAPPSPKDNFDKPDTPRADLNDAAQEIVRDS